MARTSITFIAPLANFHLSGDVAKRRMYSRVNQVMQIASIMASFGLSTMFPCSSYDDIVGTVFSVRAIVDTAMKEIEIMATTCNEQRPHPNSVTSVFNIFSK